MALIKQSERTLRSGCKRCSATDVYWAKDEDTGKFVLINATRSARAAGKGDGVGDQPGVRHLCGDNAAPVEPHAPRVVPFPVPSTD